MKVDDWSIEDLRNDEVLAVTEEELMGSEVDDVGNAEVLVRMFEKEGKIDELEGSMPESGERAGNELEKEDDIALEGKDETASSTTVITRHPALQVASSV